MIALLVFLFLSSFIPETQTSYGMIDVEHNERDFESLTESCCKAAAMMSANESVNQTTIYTGAPNIIARRSSSQLLLLSIETFRIP